MNQSGLPKVQGNYAGGDPLWRLYYDKKDGQLENQLTSGNCSAKVGKTDNAIVLTCDRFVDRGTPLAFELVLTITIEDGLIRFASELKNDQPHTIIRELQYPLVGNVQLPDDFKLLTTTHGGQLFPNPKGSINAVGNRTSYAAPAQFFRDALPSPGSPRQFPKTSEVQANSKTESPRGESPRLVLLELGSGTAGL